VNFKLLGSISRGIFARMDSMRNVFLPYHEINDYLMMKYDQNSISEDEFAEFIALWFYTFQLYMFSKNSTESALPKWRNLISGNSDLKSWYGKFINESSNFYKRRYSMVAESLKI